MSINATDECIIRLLEDFFQADFSGAHRESLIPELDSISFIELVVKTEAEFDIELYDEELLYKSGITIQDWIDIVQSHLIDSTDSDGQLNPYLK